MIYAIIVKYAKFCYILTESKLLPRAPFFDYKFHTFAVDLYPTFTAPFQSEAHLESSWTSVVEHFSEIVDVFRPLAICVKDTFSGLRRYLVNESPLKLMKNDFYFIFKALFILKIFKFLSWYFGHVKKRLD